MRSRLRDYLPATVGAVTGILIVGWLGLTDWAWTDYDQEARPAFDALFSGHLLQFLRLVPAYGGSLVMRAPFVFVPKLWGGGELALYRSVAAPCLLATGLFGLWLVRRLRAQGAARLTRGVALMLCAANPIAVLALESGHPETLLGAVLCVAAVLTAMANRPVWAGVLIGLAVANQEWALVAVGPVLIALPRYRIRALLAAGGVAAALLAPLVLTAGGEGFVAQVHGAALPNTLTFTPGQVWWFLGPHLHHIIPSRPWATRLAPGWLAPIAHLLIVAVALPLTLLCAWLRRRASQRPRHEALLLLVLVLLLRCALDPWDNWYYPLPFVLALVAWETLSFDRPPVLALIASVAVWCLGKWLVPSHGFSLDAQSVAFLILTMPALTAIAVTLYAPGLRQLLVPSRTRREPLVNLA